MRTLAPVLRTFGQSTVADTPDTPSSFAVTNPGTDGDLAITWGGSYNARDRVCVYNASDDSLLGIFKATVGSGTIGNLTNGTLYTMYVKATADNINFSTASDEESGTPSKTSIGSIQSTVGTKSTTSGVRG